ncbi:MAG: hypothetical protein HY822_15235 [Acidobacteria bacterium]|nr:hypothetical protein [Acidobacteriota bacterium]
MRLTRLNLTRILGLLALSMAGTWTAGAQDKTPRRLESVNWSPSDHKLTWVISNGVKDAAGKYKAVKSQTYLIDMSAATMTFNGEGRRFSRDEARNVQALMDLLAKYAVESTIWWDQGQGTPIGKEGKDETEVTTPRRPPKPVAPPKRPAGIVKVSTGSER